MAGCKCYIITFDLEPAFFQFATQKTAPTFGFCITNLHFNVKTIVHLSYLPLNTPI